MFGLTPSATNGYGTWVASSGYRIQPPLLNSAVMLLAVDRAALSIHLPMDLPFLLPRELPAIACPVPGDLPVDLCLVRFQLGRFACCQLTRPNTLGDAVLLILGTRFIMRSLLALSWRRRAGTLGKTDRQGHGSQNHCVNNVTLHANASLKSITVALNPASSNELCQIQVKRSIHPQVSAIYGDAM